MRKLKLFKFGTGEVHNLNYMSKVVNDWAEKEKVLLVQVSPAVDLAGFLVLSVLYEVVDD
jgi:hypothetical protein